MLNRFIDTIRNISHTSGFEDYLNSLLRRGCSGMPTVNEARKDYQALVRRDSTWMA